MKRNPRLIVVLGISLALTAAQAGRLEPDDSPRGTMRTLEEVEPSMPVEASDFPLSIDTAGMTYYLTESVSNLSSIAITVDAENVTIDLNGFTLTGDGSAQGIYGTANAAGLEVKNGRLSTFRRAIDMDLASRSRIIDVRVDNDSSTAIGVGDGSQVIRCEVTDNSTRGIETASGSLILDSVALNNGHDGIYGGTDTLVQNCQAIGNDENGIRVGSGSKVSQSVASGNGLDGIKLDGDGGLVESCAVRNNGSDGIEVRTEVLVMTNQASRNTNSGIHVTGNYCRIDGNHVSSSLDGILVDDVENTIVRNSARANTTNYDIATGNDVGPLTKANLASSPWANMDY